MAGRLALAALLSAALAGCSTVIQPMPADAPADPDARMRPDLIVADPQRVAPGDVLALTFPDETLRGVHFVLESQTGGGWFHAFDLVSDGPGPGWELDWSEAGSEAFAIPDIGVGGPGPDHVLIPDIAQPGTWRICTGNAAQNICTEIEILESESSGADGEKPSASGNRDLDRGWEVGPTAECALATRDSGPAAGTRS